MRRSLETVRLKGNLGFTKTKLRLRGGWWRDRIRCETTVEEDNGEAIDGDVQVVQRRIGKEQR